MYRTKIKAFAEIDSFSAEKQFEDNLKKHIEGKSKEYILGVDEDEYKEYLLSEFSVEPLKVYKESERIDMKASPKVVQLIIQKKLENCNKKKNEEVKIYRIADCKSD